MFYHLLLLNFSLSLHFYRLERALFCIHMTPMRVHPPNTYCQAAAVKQGFDLREHAVYLIVATLTKVP